MASREENNINSGADEDLSQNNVSNGDHEGDSGQNNTSDGDDNEGDSGQKSISDGDDEGESAAQEEMRRLEGMRLSKNTIRTYTYCMGKFIGWLMDGPYHRLVVDGKIQLRRLTPSIFKEFIATRKKKRRDASGNQVNLGYESLAGYKSALHNYYKEQKEDFTFMDTELSAFYQSLKKREAKEKEDGERRVKVGKDAMPFEIFCMLAEQYAKEGNYFAWAYLILSWNLVCRTKNTEMIKFAHIGWSADSMIIWFARMTNDQDGSKMKDPMHLYANPHNPIICPVTALTCYLLSTSFEQNAGKLFPGGNQSKRFSKALSVALRTTHVEKKLKLYNLRPEDLGTHSIRKGAASYVTSIPGGPPIVAVCLRVGWTMGSVQDRYFRFEGAGDQHCGRVLSGLPADSAQLATLPPHFDMSLPETTNALLEWATLVFPIIHNECIDMLQYGMASALYHEPYLRQKLPRFSSIWSNPLFVSSSSPESVRNRFKSLICNGISSPFLRATGVPPHVKVSTQIDHLSEKVDQLPDSLTNAVKDLIESYAARPGNITQESMKRLIRDLLLEIPGRSMSSTREEIHDPLPVASASQQQYFIWNGGFHTLPEDFEFPSLTVEQAWYAWWVGNDDAPPYRVIASKDLRLRQQRKRLSDITVLMKHIELALKERSLFIEKPTPHQVREMYEQAVPFLSFMRLEEPQGRNAKRPQQWKIPTAVKRFRDSQNK